MMKNIIFIISLFFINIIFAQDSITLRIDYIDTLSYLRPSYTYTRDSLILRLNNLDTANSWRINYIVAQDTLFLSDDSLYATSGAIDLYIPDGNIRYETTTYLHGKKNGPRISYFEDGKTIFSISNYVDGLEDGETRSYFRNGKIHTIKHFTKGLPNGEVISYFRSGKIWFIGQYDMGKRIGTFTRYNILFGKGREHIYENDKLIKAQRFVFGM